MATLEKIRSKSVMLFAIIIIALLAFILGDALTSGQAYFGSGTTIAEAAGAKVDYVDYQNRINIVSEQNRNSQQDIDGDELAQEVLRELLVEKLLDQEYDALGITVTDKELSAALTGVNPHPAALQFINMMSQQLGLPTASGAEVYQAMMNPTRYGLPAEVGEQLKQYWVAVEKDLENTMKNEKFSQLVLGLYGANQLDAKNYFNDIATTRKISYVVDNYNSVADADAQITDEDRKAAWQKNMSRYTLAEPVRSVDYILVKIEPSHADRIAGKEAVDQALVALNANEGTDMVASNPKFVVSRMAAPKSRITDKTLANYVDTAKVGKASILKTVGDSYTLVKLLGVTKEVDSINVSILGRLDGGNIDSIKRELDRKAVSIETLLADTKQYQGQADVWASLVGNSVQANIKKALLDNPVGKNFIYTDSVNGTAVHTLYCINNRHKPVSVYDLAVIDYTVDPSSETISELSGNINTFVSNNSSADEFSANAAAAGYTVLNTVITAAHPHVGSVPDSRPAVKWLMNAGKGKVMPVYQDSKQSYLLAAAVKGVYDGEYLPWNADIIVTQIDAEASKAKKAEILLDRYAGKAESLDAYAELMSTTVQHGDVTFSAPMLATVGFNESALQGAVASAEQGKLVGPLQGNNGVVAFMVNEVAESGRTFTYEEYANQFNRVFNLGNVRNMSNPAYLLQLLLGDEEIENHSLNFIQGLGE